MIPDAIINEVRERVDIVALIGRYVDLKKAGTIYKACCPFHAERTPSFTVSPGRNTYHCFGCQVHGDGIRFLVEHEGRTFPEAVRELAAECGVEVPEQRSESPEQRSERLRQRTQKERLLAAQDKITGFYSRALHGPTGGPARGYLTGRGVSRRAAEAFRLGWADGHKERFHAFAQAEEITRDDLVQLGLLVQPDDGWIGDRPLWGGYLRFRRRLMFPVVDLRGEVTGYSGRILDAHTKAAKYINSPETPIFTKGDQLYGAHTARNAARRAGRLVLVEGNVDVVSLWQAGVEGTAAAMGTALTPKQARLVKRLSERVVCVMDGDAAGQKAAFASLGSFLAIGIQPRAVMLPAGADPDSYVAEQGIDAFSKLLDDARPLLDLFIEKVAAEHPADPPGRAEALREIAPVLGALEDELSLELYRVQTEQALGVTGALVDRALAAARADTERTQAKVARRLAAQGRRGPGPAPRKSQDTPRFEGPPPLGPGEPPFFDEPEKGQPTPFPPTGPFGGFEEVFSADPGAPEVFPDETPPLLRLDVPGFESEVIELIVQFPELAPRFVKEGWHKSLTHPDLTAFVRSLDEEVTAGRAPNQDRLLTEIADQGVVAFLRQRQARRPWQSEETIELAFAEVVGKLMPKATLMRRRLEILQQIAAVGAEHGSSTAANETEQMCVLREQLSQINAQLETLAHGKN